MADLFDIAAQVAKLGSLNQDAAREAEGPVLDAMRTTASAGTSPSGEAWAPKKDGGRALSGAAAALTSEVKGNKVSVRVGAPYVFHNYGAGGSSQTREAKRARSGAKKARAAAEASGQKIGKSKFHAPQRQIIPQVDDPMPEPVADAVRAAADRVFARATGGKA